MLFQINDATLSLGGQEIFSHIHFQIKGREKLALTGPNGAGKTSLLRLIAGELTADRDDKRRENAIRTDRKLDIRLLHQTPGPEVELTIRQMIAEAGGSAEFELEYDRMMTELGFELSQKERKISSFSGGQQTLLFLIRELLVKPDLLLLDEPTNHLDVETCQWLERTLQRYDKALIVVSHDRFFLDQVAEGVWELWDGTLTHYNGNYSEYRRQKQRNLEAQRKRYEHQQAEIKRLNRLIEKFRTKPKKAAFARSRKSMIQRMERVQRPREEDSFRFTEAIEPLCVCSKWAVRAEKLRIGYRKKTDGEKPGDLPILWQYSPMDFRIRRGQKIGIIGDNGAGKTTLLKTIAGLLEPLGGSCRLGERVQMGYFDQQTAQISDEVTVLEHFRRLFPGKTDKETRQQLAAWLFRGEDVKKQVKKLSGGEKSRLILAELLTARPNLLLLDEPTNHMDIPSKETIESALSAYTGTILFISHDRYFIRQVAEALLVMDGDELLYYPFGYEHYLERRSRPAAEGISLTAMVRAEDQAMVEGLRAVPEAERHRLREISTGQASYEWQLRLAAEAMDEAAKKAKTMRQQYLEKIAASYGEDDGLPEAPELWAAEEAWTKACLEWYEVYSSR